MNANIQQLIDRTVTALDQDPMSQSADTYSLLVEFTKSLAVELGEIVAASPYPYGRGTPMYFDEKVARYEIKKAVGLL